MVDVFPISQMDPRWRDKPLGFVTTTIGKYGCLLTCLAMVANCYGFNETPITLNEKMKQAQGYDGPRIIPKVIPAALPGLIFRGYTDCSTAPAPLAEIDRFLAQGKPVIAQVDSQPDPGMQNHWVVLYARCAGDYLIRDPWPYPPQMGEVTLLTSRYRFSGKLSQIIKGVVLVEGAGAPIPGPKTDLDQGIRAGFPVYPTVDGLALRSAPSDGDETLIKRLPLGAQLTVLESGLAARVKIGLLSQWLAVLDPTDGCQGYVAAWYVTAVPPVAGSEN